jgi:hypothetical protein
MSIIIDTPEGIEAYRMMAIHARLKIEMKGLKFRVNTFSAVRRELGMTSRAPRKTAIEAWEKKMTEAGIKFTPYA